MGWYEGITEDSGRRCTDRMTRDCDQVSDGNATKKRLIEGSGAVQGKWQRSNLKRDAKRIGVLETPNLTSRGKGSFAYRCCYGFWFFACHLEEHVPAVIRI